MQINFKNMFKKIIYLHINAPTKMENIWNNKMKKTNKTNFLVLIFSMIAPAICKKYFG